MMIPVQQGLYSSSNIVGLSGLCFSALLPWGISLWLESGCNEVVAVSAEEKYHGPAESALINTPKGFWPW